MAGLRIALAMGDPLKVACPRSRGGDDREHATLPIPGIPLLPAPNPRTS